MKNKLKPGDLVKVKFDCEIFFLWSYNHITTGQAPLILENSIYLIIATCQTSQIHCIGGDDLVLYSSCGSVGVRSGNYFEKIKIR